MEDLFTGCAHECSNHILSHNCTSGHHHGVNTTIKVGSEEYLGLVALAAIDVAWSGKNRLGRLHFFFYRCRPTFWTVPAAARATNACKH